MKRHIRDITAAFADAVNEYGLSRERILCSVASYQLQCESDDYIVLLETPLKEGKNIDICADLILYSRSSAFLPVWVEVKPMWQGSNYWNFSKFFNGKLPEGDIHLADSIILNDIDRINAVRNEPTFRCEFSFVLMLDPWRRTEYALSEPRPGSSLYPDQATELCRRRFQAVGGRPPLVDSIEEGTWAIFQFVFGDLGPSK